MLDISNTVRFLRMIRDTFEHGEITNEGYYSWATFSYAGKKYMITDKDAFLMRVYRKMDDTDTVILQVAPHKSNKEGMRERYTFVITLDLPCEMCQISIECSRLNAALLIPGCIDRLIEDDDAEINHKATLQTQSGRLVFTKSVEAWSMFKTLTGSCGLAREAAIDIVRDNYKDIFENACSLSDDFKRKPVFPRDNRVQNLEVCSGRENRAHYKAVKEFDILSKELPKPAIKDINRRRIPARVATYYTGGILSRKDFINYVNTQCSIVDIDEVIKANFTSPISDKARRLAREGIISFKN